LVWFTGLQEALGYTLSVLLDVMVRRNGPRTDLTLHPLEAFHATPGVSDEVLGFKS